MTKYVRFLKKYLVSMKLAICPGQEYDLDG